MKNIISASTISAIALSAVTALPFTLMGSSASACTDCNVALTATTPNTLGTVCEYTAASLDGSYSFTAATTANATNRFITNGAAANRGQIGIKVRGNASVRMSIDPTLYVFGGQTAVPNVTVRANYNPGGGGAALTSEITNTFNGSTVFANVVTANDHMGIDVSGRNGTDTVTFKVGGIAVLSATTAGADPLDFITTSTNYTIKHVATCVQ